MKSLFLFLSQFLVISIFCQTSICTNSPFSESWVYAGPPHDIVRGTIPTLGLVHSVEMLPSNNNILFAGSNTSGLYKSIDNGVSWYSVTDDLLYPGIGVLSIAVDPFDDNIIYATTGATSNGYGGYSVGVIKSINQGETWEEISLPNSSFSNHFEDYALNSIKIDPSNSSKIIVGGHKALYMSSDAGISWTEIVGWNNSMDLNGYILNNKENWVFADIEFNPQNSSEIYASTIDFKSGQYAQENAFILRSLDGGATWERLENLGVLLPAGAQQNIQLDFSSANPGVLNAVFLNASQQLTFATSDDQGESWDIHFSEPNTINFSVYKGEFEVSEINADVIYVGGVTFKIFKFEGGAWLSDIQYTNWHADIRSLKLYPNVNGIDESLLIGNDGGICYQSLNPTNFIINTSDISWQSKNGEGLLLTQIYGGGSWDNDHRGIYGAQDNGSWRYDAFSDDFLPTIGSDGAFSSTSKYFGGKGVVGNQSSRSYTLNYGVSNSSLLILGSSDSKHLKVEQEFVEKDERILVVADKELTFLSIDEFNVLSTLQTTSFGVDQQISGHGVAPSNSNIVYVFFAGAYWTSIGALIEDPDPTIVNGGLLINRFFKSEDGGNTFIDLTNEFSLDNGASSPYEWDEVNTLEIDPRNAQHIYVGMKFFNSGPKVLESMDGGLTWTDKSQGLGEFPIHDILYQDGSDEILYAATDGGVYRWNKLLSTWECFNNGLVPSIVTDLDFDYCSRTLTAYTYGKGVWTIQTPEHDHPTTFTEDYTVDAFEEHTFDGDVIVEQGVTLTVKGQLFFHEHTRLIVKEGGKLIVDGGLLSSKCGQLWQGVEVWGDESLSQSPTTNQGHIVLKNNAVIENAHTGIWVQRNDEDCSLVSGTGGGIVHASNSTIQNCYVGVEYAPYIWLTSQGNPVYNKSFFKNVTFQQTEVLLNDNLFKSHARLVHVYGIRFQGCTFYDALPDNPSYGYLYNNGYKKMGYGIDSHSSHFLVTPYCDGTIGLGGECNGTVIYPYFEGLEIGVVATDGVGDRNFKVNQATFVGNMRGIYASSQILGCEITENIFTIHPIVAGHNALGASVEAIGTVMQKSTGFKVESNTYVGDHLLGNGNTNQELIGAVFIDTQEFPNECYRNQFDGLDFGIHAQGNNGGINGNGEYTGLQFICNQFGQSIEENEVDISVPDYSSIANSQGAFASEETARNSFSHLENCVFDGLETDINVANNPTTPAFSYFYGGGADENDISNFNKPICFTESKVGDQRIPDADLTCPSKLINHLVKSELVVKMVESSGSLDDVHGIYYGHLDKGDVQALESFILNPINSSIEVRNEMISCIPYISDNAFKTAFTRTPSLNEWHLAQVLLMSSPLKQSVINMMSYYNLDPFYRELVLNGQGGGVTNMMIFEADMNLLSKTAETAFQDLAKLSVFNENDNAGYIDLFDYIGQYDAGQADFLQIPLFLTQKEFISASTVLNSCPIDDSYCDVLSIQALSLSTNQDCPKFSQQEVSQLQVIALDDTKPGNIFARDVLREVTDEEIEFELHFNSNSRSLMKEESPMVFSFLTAYPNPAQTVTYLTTEIPEGVEKVQIELIDAQGRIERSFYPLERIGVIELNVSNLETGIYLCKLYFDGIHIESEKILVLH